MSKLLKFYQTNIPCPKHPTVLLEVRCPAYGSSSDYTLTCDECVLDEFLDRPGILR